MVKVKKLWPLIIGFIVIIYFISKHYRDSYFIEKDGVVTSGKVIKFTTSTASKHSIVYEYYVDGKRYESSTSCSYFISDETGKEGCVGSKFPVKYSKSHPSSSQIDLGKYNKYKFKSLL
ncbi:hypothetical protein ACG2LH_07115 [Zhouia sp. PK063]|uniref:DUF3592 domain-containing protein n=1 Tax=Zhouia sp. PK063 TaxID=3373602 RepID=UPI0037B1C0BC